MNLDLKWNLWSRDAETFPAEALAALQRAFANKAHAVTVYTAPRKEIRFGTVVVTGHSATVDFYTVWDQPHELCSCPEQIDAAWGWFSEGFDDGSPIGARVTRCVSAHSFKGLLRAIDRLEAELLKADEEAWAEFSTRFEVK